LSRHAILQNTKATTLDQHCAATGTAGILEVANQTVAITSVDVAQAGIVPD
jgi:hypothetical protein